MRNRSLHRTVGDRSWLFASLLAATGSWPGEISAQASERDEWQRVPEVIAALGIGVGSRVADVGAGGRIFAVEIGEGALSRLERLAEGDSLANIEVVRGEVADPRLPERSLDAVLVVDAYHEMTEHEAMLAGMYRALRPGGRLLILDLVPQDGSALRDRQTDRHRIGIDMVETEVRAAGYEVLERDPEFTRTGRGRGQWMLVARRPVK